MNKVVLKPPETHELPPSNIKLKELPGAILGRSLKVATFGHTYINKHLLLYAELTGGMKKKKKSPPGIIQKLRRQVEVARWLKNGCFCPRSG